MIVNTKPISPQDILNRIPVQRQERIDQLIELLNRDIRKPSSVDIFRQRGWATVTVYYAESQLDMFDAWLDCHSEVMEQFRNAGWTVRYAGKFIRGEQDKPTELYLVGFSPEKLPKIDPSCIHNEVITGWVKVL